MADGAHTQEKNPGVIYFLTLSATLSGFLFGYDTAIINGALILLEKDMPMSSQKAAVVVASTIFSAAIFSLTAGVVSDKIGRKPTIMMSSLIFVTGGSLMAVAPNVETVIAGRLVVGIAIGFVSSVVPVYISECSPPGIRGLLITMNQLLITFGILISAILAGALQEVNGGWRIMLGVSVIPGIAQFICFLSLPDSPRYQIMKEKQEQAEKTLKYIRKKSDVSEEIQDMKRQIEEQKGNSGGTLQILKQMWSIPHVRKALIIGCMLQLFQQWCGINAVIYYSSTILIGAGFSSKLAIWLAVIPFTINFLATFIGLWAVESLGRKLVLALSFLAIATALVVLCAGFLLAQLNSPNARHTHDIVSENSHCKDYRTCYLCVADSDCGFCYLGDPSSVRDGACVNASANSDAAAEGRCSKKNNTDTYVEPNAHYSYSFCPSEYSWLAVLGTVLFVLGFAPGAGPMPWTINAEIYPGWARGLANSIASFTNWTCNVLLSFFFLIMLHAITAWGTFLLFCGVCILGAIFVMAFVPETKDKSLEEIELLFMTEATRREALQHRSTKLEEEEGGDHRASYDKAGHESPRGAHATPTYGPGLTGSTFLF